MMGDDIDLVEGSFCKSGYCEVERKGGEEVPDAIAGNQHSHMGKWLLRKRLNPIAEHVSSRPVPTCKSSRGRARTPNRAHA